MKKTNIDSAPNTLRTFLPFFLVIAICNFSFTPLFSDTRNNAGEVFKKAQSLSEKGEDRKALELYLKAFEMSPKNGFYAGRVGQHYYKIFRDYSNALTYYLKALNLDFRGEWMLVQMVYTLDWLGHIALSENEVNKALKYFSSAISVGQNTSKLSNKLTDLKNKYSLFKKYSSPENIRPEYVHKVTAVLIRKVDFRKGNIRIKEEMNEMETRFSLISLKTLKPFVEALSGGKLSIDLKIRQWSAPVKSLKVENAQKYVLDTEGLSLEVEKLIAENIPSTDTFIYIWPSGSKQSAHGGAGNFFLEMGQKKAWRGLIQAPSFRMPWNGPDLLVHEFFHVVENMASINPRHGYYPENRSRFPDWKGEGELDYYFWHFQEIIPKLLKSGKFQEPGWKNLNFSGRYSISKN